MMAYGLKAAFHLHYPFSRMNSPLEEKEEDFVAYQERKRSERKSSAELLWAGLAYMIATVIFLVIDLLATGA